MAIGIYFDGRRLIRPQAATKIDDSGMFARGLGGANTLALVGECSGGEPGKVMYFTDPSYAKAILRSGDLLTAIQRAYAPSAEVNGAYLVAAIRVNPAQQAALTLKDAVGNSLIDLSSIDYGIWNNQIKVRVEDGTVKGKKLTVTYGNTYDQGDNIAKKSLVIGLTDPLATLATLAIGSGSLSTVLHVTPQAVYKDSSPENLNTGTFDLSIGTGDTLYIGSDSPFDTIYFTMDGSNVNAQTATLSVKFWNGASWATVTPTNTTVTAGAPLAKSGSISWDISAFSSPWLKSTWQSVTLYWIQITTSANLTAGTAAVAGNNGESSGIRLYRPSLDITLADYPTIQLLTDYIDAQPGYLADILTPNSEDLTSELDDISASPVTSLLLYAIELTDAYVLGSKSLVVNSTSGIQEGDYVTVAKVDGSFSEMRRVTHVGSLALSIDSDLSIAYETSSPVRVGVNINSDLQAIIDWINLGNTAFLLAGYPDTATTRGVLANVPETYLSGGSEGTTDQEDWDAALDLLKTEDTSLISCVSVDPAVWASLSAHCEYMSTVGKKERRGFCGGFDSNFGTNGLGKWNGFTNQQSSIQKMLNYAFEINSDRMSYVGPGFKAYDENGILKTYSGAISAALVAGMFAGVDVATALTHVLISVIGLEFNLQWGDLDRLLEGGVLPLEYDPGIGYRVCQSISTWLQNDKYNRREVSVGRTADFVARQVRERLENDFVGKKGTITTLISIKNAVISVLTQMARAELLAGDANNPPFKNIQCRLEGDTCWVDFEASPVIPINYIPITIHLTVFTSTLTA